MFSSGSRNSAASRFVLAGLIVLPLLFATSELAFAQDRSSQNRGVRSAGYPCLGVITAARARVRTGPSDNHFAFTTLDSASRVIVHGVKGEWSEIALPPYRHVWIHGDFVVDAGKNAQGISELRVRGTKVRLRGTPGTDHEHIGFAGNHMILKSTGRRDKSGKWVQCLAPFTARVFVHSSLIELGNKVRPAELPILFRGLRPPGVPANLAGGIGAAADVKDVEKLVPGNVSPRLERIFDVFRAEHAKKPVFWNFGSVLAELATIEKTSEDLGEIRLAQELTAHIEGKLMPIQSDFAEAEKRQLAARRGVVAGQRMEKEITKAVHRESSPDDKHVSVGWVVGLGKHRKVEGTHMLKKGNRLLFYLKSDKIDLDRYVNKRIGVNGIKQEQPPTAGAQLILVTSVEVLSH